ncbi:hypothetical protein [Desulfogranum japonicum]|uniref:hypothetical protein n=1 Tax=Desulfogranum japonicum TaxID=231447 RepID=UPI001294640A|nr:hypothetical protein [Desulfogranum japonicum]
MKTLFFGVSAKGFPSLVVALSFFSGIQLLFLGVIGEYLTRPYEEVKGRPTCIIAESTLQRSEMKGHE